MRYRVHGINRMTGVEASIVVEAKHHEAAEAIAQRHMIVAEVIPEGGLTEPEIFDRLAADRVGQPPAEPGTSHPRPILSPRPARRAWATARILAIGLIAVLLLWLRRR